MPFQDDKIEFSQSRVLNKKCEFYAHYRPMTAAS